MHRRESEAELRLKLTSVVARHQDMKTAFTDLKSQINVGLLQVYTLVLPFSIRSFDYDLILFVTNTTTNKKNSGRRSLRIARNSLDEAGRSEDRGDGSRGSIQYHHHQQQQLRSGKSFFIISKFYFN
jgi:hypothetical protein